MEKGSLVNQIASNSKTKLPTLNEGATVYLWTDRHAYKVIEVSKDQKSCKIQRFDPERVDDLGMSDCQSYKYEKLTEEILQLKFLWNQWKVVGSRVDFTKKFIKESEESGELFPPTYLRKKYGKEMVEKVYDSSAVPVNVVDGITRRRRSYNSISIQFGVLDEHYDFSF